MFSIVEQKILLEMLKNERLNLPSKSKSKPSAYYRTMRLLRENELIEIEKNGNSKNYKLTIYGKAIASFIAKHTKTEVIYKRFAYTITYLVDKNEI